MKDVQHWIAGAAVAGAGSAALPVFNPATGEVSAQVPVATSSEIDEAIAAARTAAKAWGETSLAVRVGVLFRFRELLLSRRDEVAEVIVAENGKVRADALGEVGRGLENVEFACGIPTLLRGYHSEQVATDVDVHSVRQPVGVVLGVTPFNFPAMVPLWMLSNAIACGNAFVLKPSEKVPSASLVLARLLAEAGLPSGVFSVLHGDKDTVQTLIARPEVDAVTFVGSTPVARAVYQKATAAGKRAQALGGAKNHMVVLPDADIDVAADAAMSAAFGAAGERCMAVSVVVAVGGAADPLVDALKQRVASVRVGPGDDPGSDLGPLITREHRDRVAGYVAQAEADGDRIVVDGRALGASGEGFFLGCTIVDSSSTESAVYRDEVFGPVLLVLRVASLTEAIEIIRRNPYGNGAALFTRNGAAARRFQREAPVGMIGINVAIPVPVAYYSFGGWKSSLFGDMRMYGPEGIRFFTNEKVVTSRWSQPPDSALSLSFARIASDPA